MKTGILKWGLLSLVLVLTWIGCPNPRQVDNIRKEALEILLPSNPIDFSSDRSVEDIHVNASPHYFKDVTVYLKYLDTPIHTYAWSAEEIAAKKKLLVGTGTPSFIFVVVNGEQLANTQFASIDALYVALDLLSVESQNVPITILANDVNGNLAGTYTKSQTAFLSGISQYTIPHPTINNAVQTPVQLASSIARFELGTLRAANPAELTSVTVNAVYVNDYYTTLGKTNSVEIPESNWNANKPTYGNWSRITGNNTVTSNTGTKCYAFQLFPSTVIPYFIYEISGTLAPGVSLLDGETNSFTGKYITITGFTQFSGATQQHHVYKIGLTGGGIDITTDKISQSPNMNVMRSNMTIYPLTENNITPDI